MQIFFSAKCDWEPSSKAQCWCKLKIDQWSWHLKKVFVIMTKQAAKTLWEGVLYFVRMDTVGWHGLKSPCISFYKAKETFILLSLIENKERLRHLLPCGCIRKILSQLCMEKNTLRFRYSLAPKLRQGLMKHIRVGFIVSASSTDTTNLGSL